MTDRNRELVPDTLSRVRERALTTGLFFRKDGFLNTLLSAEERKKECKGEEVLKSRRGLDEK